MTSSDVKTTKTNINSVSEVMSDFSHGKASDACKLAEDVANRLLDEECEKKEFVIDSGRPCPTTGEQALVDLVVLIDTSGSMQGEAQNLSDAADAAIQAAAANCPSDLRVEWFGIEGTWLGTNFTQSYRDYLDGLPGPLPPLVGTVGDLEDGAAAIQDISNFFNWRTGATKIIFFLGDEGLEGGNPQDATDVTAADAAIAVANAEGVIVHMYAGTGILPATTPEYQRVASSTGGEFFSAAAGDINNFEAVLEEVICSGTQVCKPAEIPELLPCFKIHWGDGPKDMIETTDTECLCITACNRYSNVTFKDLTVVISVVTKADGSPVPDLPDGTPSVYIKPSKFICFGDLPPCDPNKPDDLSCISRELVLVSCGAMEGEYCLKIGYCYSLHFDLRGVDEFKLPLCAS